MKHLVIVIALAAGACGSKKQQPSSESTTPAPTPTEVAPMKPEECTAQGGQVKGDIGDGNVKCGDGERDLGRVAQGIEGAVCCAPPAATP